MRSTLRRVIEAVPGVRRLLRAWHVRRVRKGPEGWLFWGVFSSYSDAMNGARATAPRSRVVGYDAPEIARKGRGYERMYLHDYPALFWLARFSALASGDAGATGRTVVDLGGHLGEKYRLFRRLWGPTHVHSWVVLETSATVEIGKGLPAADCPPGLSFTTDRTILEGADILYASGSLQYLEQDLCVLLDGVNRPPAHLVLNKVPLTEGAECWTVQNAWVAAVPYHVMNRARFVGQLAERGYRVLDEWSTPGLSVAIPFHRHPGTATNSGLSLTRARDL